MWFFFFFISSSCTILLPPPPTFPSPSSSLLCVSPPFIFFLPHYFVYAVAIVFHISAKISSFVSDSLWWLWWPQLHVFFPRLHCILDWLYNSDGKTGLQKQLRKKKKKKKKKWKENTHQAQDRKVVYVTGVRKWTDFYRYVCCFLYIEVKKNPLTINYLIRTEQYAWGSLRRWDIYWPISECCHCHCCCLVVGWAAETLR